MNYTGWSKNTFLAPEWPLLIHRKPFAPTNNKKNVYISENVLETRFAHKNRCSVALALLMNQFLRLGDVY